MSENDAKAVEIVSNEPGQLEDGKNKQTIKCKFCGSKILDKKSADFVTQEINLPLMQQEVKKEVEVQQEALKDFWHVENIYNFENIGFTHTVENIKYLSCADCEAGPVGYHNTTTKHSYVALTRVCYV